MFVSATIDRFEGEKAVLVTDDGDQIIWPQSKLPAHAQAGNVVSLVLVDEQIKDPDNEKLARNILNEILKIDSDEE